MKDDEIIALYFRRDEDAIRQTELAYGGKLYNLSYRLLWNREDAEESVSDTYMKAWENIPPTKPTFFYAYLAKICRFLAMGKLDWNNAAKRKAEVVELSDEMENCIPDLSREMQIQSQPGKPANFHAPLLVCREHCRNCPAVPPGGKQRQNQIDAHPKRPAFIS